MIDHNHPNKSLRYLIEFMNDSKEMEANLQMQATDRPTKDNKIYSFLLKAFSPY